MRSRRGFTLVELLVVVSIIALLLSILTPSLRKSRDQARRTQCMAHLRAIFLANTVYIGEEGRFPDLNNDPDDGTWQYNYLIFDGQDFDNNFGPLARDGRIVEYIEQLFCPVQTDPFHSLNTPENRWPVRLMLDTRSGYGRRYHLSGKSPSQIKKTVGFAADAFHLPQVVRSGHKVGLNAAYTDGHAQWIKDPGIFTHNELAKPFSVRDNPIIEDLWKTIDSSQ